MRKTVFVIAAVIAALVPAVSAQAATGATVASPRRPLHVRAGAAAWTASLGTLPDGAPITIDCQVKGQRIDQGPVRVTDRWDRLDTGAYVSDAYVNRANTPPACAAAAQPATGADRWVSPLPGFSARPGFRTPANPNHVGVDLMSFVGTPIHAAAAGTVVEVVCDISAGHSCDQPGSASVRGCGWYVKLQHAGGISTLYCHMVRRAVVQPGQHVAAGQVIGYVGSSGNSSAPHLHFEVHVNTPPTSPANAIDPLPFMRAHGAPIG